jgi:hypothetical protein
MTRTVAGWIGRWLERIIFTIFGLAVVLYAGDWSIYHLRSKPVDQVMVYRYLAVPLKGHKTEYDFEDSGPVPCARALFPQSGNTPCWYLRRHSAQFTNL